MGDARNAEPRVETMVGRPAALRSSDAKLGMSWKGFRACRWPSRSAWQPRPALWLAHGGDDTSSLAWVVLGPHPDLQEGIRKGTSRNSLLRHFQLEFAVLAEQMRE